MFDMRKAQDGVPSFARAVGNMYLSMIDVCGRHDRDRFLVVGKDGEIADVEWREVEDSPWEDKELANRIADVLCGIGGKELVVITGVESKIAKQGDKMGVMIRWKGDGEDLVLMHQTPKEQRCFVSLKDQPGERGWVEMEDETGNGQPVGCGGVLDDLWKRMSMRWN